MIEIVSTRHNPEFSLLELYQAYANLEDMMDLVEEMYAAVCTEVNGSPTLVVRGGPQGGEEEVVHRAALLDARLYVLRLDADGAIERASGRERPHHAKQQAVDVMMRDAREHRRIADELAPLTLQRMHLSIELRERLVNRLRRAAAARCVERQRRIRIDF